MRRREVGVRLALGAARSHIVSLFLIQGIRVTAIGCIAGLGLSVATGRLVAGVLVLILLVATAASLLPAWRAARVEPVKVLREE